MSWWPISRLMSVIPYAAYVRLLALAEQGVLLIFFTADQNHTQNLDINIALSNITVTIDSLMTMLNVDLVVPNLPLV